MRIINRMPFSECESCKLCVLNVDDGRDSATGEKKIFVGCRNEKKCIRRKGRHHAEQK